MDNMKKELLIFGASGALGKESVKFFVEKDYEKIYLFGSSPEKINAPKAKIVITKDLSVEENVIKSFIDIKPGKDKLFFLFSTVGGFYGGHYLWETSSLDWDNMMNKNLKTNFLIAKHFSKLVKESAGGAICFVSAYSGLYAEKKKAAYGISKSALVHLVKSLALEGNEINLSINAIAPYIIDTTENRRWMADSDFKNWIKPLEIIELANSLFLCFNFITGNVLTLKDRFEVSGF